VIDIFSIKPVDEATIYACAKKSGGKILTVEDHFIEGGIRGISYLIIKHRCCMQCYGKV
jgi:transketolase C-terminal domain/subunit